MEPVHYVRILRRRIKLILLLTVVGALIGLATSFAPESTDDESQQYVAAHILIDENDAERPANLGLASILLTTGEVPARVAEELGFPDPAALASRIIVTVDQQNRTVKVNAVADDPRRAEDLANTFATVGTAYMVEREIGDAADQLAQLGEQRSRLEANYDRLSDQIAELTPDEQEERSSELSQLASQISAIQAQIDSLETEPVPSERLGTLAEATAVPASPQMIQSLVAEANNRGGQQGQGRNTVVTVGALQEASSGDESVAPGLALRTLGGGVLGALIGIATALVLQRFDRRLRTREDTEEAFGLPVLAEIPPLPRTQQNLTSVLAYDSPRSPTAEAYRALRSSVVFMGDANAPHQPDADELMVTPGRRAAKVIMVTSAGPSEGKTTSAANLAAVLGEAGYSVLALNCDFRKPRLHTYLRAERAPRKVVESPIPGVRVITDVVTDASRVNPAEVIAAQRQVIHSARELFDIIILDTAPLLTTNDAVDLLAETDLLVLVCRAGRSSRDAAMRCVEVLKRHNAPIAGCVLVGADEGLPSQYYYYYGDESSEGNGSASGNGSTAKRNGSGTKDDTGGPGRGSGPPEPPSVTTMFDLGTSD